MSKPDDDLDLEDEISINSGTQPPSKDTDESEDEEE